MYPGSGRFMGFEWYWQFPKCQDWASWLPGRFLATLTSLLITPMLRMLLVGHPHPVPALLLFKDGPHMICLVLILIHRPWDIGNHFYHVFLKIDVPCHHILVLTYIFNLPFFLVICKKVGYLPHTGTTTVCHSFFKVPFCFLLNRNPAVGAYMRQIFSRFLVLR